MEQQQVLVVDDDADIRAFVALELEHHGYGVIEAENGRTAIEVIERESPAVTLLDMRMPGMSGLDVLNHLADGDAVTPTSVVVMSARADTATVEAALTAGAIGYVIKPFDLDEVVASVKAAHRRPVA